MPIELPNLDDKTWSELVEEARASIPAIAPQWTDHNPSDPGMTLVELLAWLTEVLIYRTGSIPEQSVRTFLRILSGKDAGNHVQSAPLDEAIRLTMRALREPYRAVTAEDYECLVAHQWPLSDQARALKELAPILRTKCLPGCELTGAALQTDAPGHVSLIVLPKTGIGSSPWFAPSQELLLALVDFFRDRQLVATQFHVGGPVYVPISIEATIHLRGDADSAKVMTDAKKMLADYFDPNIGGLGGDGWPLGRDILASEVYAVLDRVSGVESVPTVALPAQSTSPPNSPSIARSAQKVISIRPLPGDINSSGKSTRFRLSPHELPCVAQNQITLTLKEWRRDQWIVLE